MRDLYNGTALIYILFCVWGLLGTIALVTTADNEDLVKAIAKEWNIPVSQVQDITGHTIKSETKWLPLPHTVWYVTTERGEDIEIASDYFGGDIDLDKEALDKCFMFSNFQEIYRNIPVW